MDYDVVIVGGGPAGLTAALYTGRAKLKTKVIERSSAGGQILLTELIENFPGVYRMNSRDWVATLKKQLSDLDCVAILEEAEVSRIESAGAVFRTTVVSQADHHKDILESHCVIVATGAVPKRLGIKGEEALIGRGVSFCATCDGPLFRDRTVLLVGGGDTAIEEALYLRKFAQKIIIVHRRDALRATAVLQEKVLKDEKIEFRWNATPLEILGKTRVEGVRIKDIKTGKEEVVACEGVFVFIGFSPDTVFLKGLLDLNNKDCVITDENLMSSSTGVFAAGDCRARPFNQVVTACSDGALAAYAAMKFLENKI
jgi:thioredoxin reductase (NADPH)